MTDATETTETFTPAAPGTLATWGEGYGAEVALLVRYQRTLTNPDLSYPRDVYEAILLSDRQGLQRIELELPRGRKDRNPHYRVIGWEAVNGVAVGPRG